MIFERTRAALAVRKRQDARLGNRTNLARARRFADNIAPMIRAISADGVVSLRGIAVLLDKRQVRTARGRRWQATQVSMLLIRAVDPNLGRE